MWKAVIASLRGHKRRTVAMGSAVLLGVAFLSGTMVLGDTMRAGFGDLFGEANAGTDVMVRSSDVIQAYELVDRGTLDAGLLAEVSAVQGVTAAEPFIEGSGQIVGADGQPLGGDGPPTVAGNWVRHEGLNPYQIVEGRPPEQPAEAGSTAEGSEPYEVVIDRASARNGALTVGDRTVVRVPEPVQAVVVGIAKFGDRDSLGPVTYVAFTTEAAQDLLLPEPGGLSGIVVAAEPGIDPDALATRLQEALPDGVEALTGEALTSEQMDEIEGDFLSFLETALLVFAGIALVVATFSIYNTFSIVVAQRTRESALLRALGASRRQVLSAVIAEAAAIGLLASALGIVAGVGLSVGLSALFDALDFSLPATDLVISQGSVIVSLVVGVVVTLLAGVAPAVKASRVLPMAALRDVAIDRSSVSRVRMVLGPVVTALGATVTVLGATVTNDLLTTGAGALLTVVGVVLFGPVVARPVSSLLGAPLERLRGTTGKLARANAMRNPTRTSGTAAALMVGVAVVGMFTLLAASLRLYIQDTIDSSFRGDLVLLDEGFSGSGFSPELATEIDALPEVDAAAALGFGLARLDGSDQLVTITDLPKLDRVLDIDVREGSPGGVTDGAVAVSGTFADDNAWALGDQVAAVFASGAERDLTVAAVYEGKDIVGDIVLPEQTSELAGVSVTTDFVMIGLAEGVTVDNGRAAVQAVANRFSGPMVQDGQELAESQAAQIDQVLTIIYVLLALTVLIALMAIATTLSLSIHERTRELGLLRAVGQSRRQLRAMVRGESMIVALFGTVGGLGLGCFLGWALTTGLSESLGTTGIPLAIPFGQLGVVFVLGGLAGLLAATRPARRAAKIDVLQAVLTE